MENIFLSPIRSRFCDEIVFKLNSDDFNKSDIKKITNHLRNKGFNFKKQRSYDKVKLMSWVTFKIKMESIYDNNTNDIIARQIISKALDK